MASSIEHTEILHVQKQHAQVKQRQVKPLTFIVEQMDLSPTKNIEKKNFDKQSFMFEPKLNEMPGKLLELKHQNSAMTSNNNRIDLSQRLKISCVKTKNCGSNSMNNNFLLSPGALHRTQSTLSMSLLKNKHKQSLSSGPCEKIHEEEESNEWTQNDPKETMQQLHCLKNMLVKKHKIRAPPSYKNRCQNCHILNMTMYKKSSPKKQLLLQNQQKFEKLIDEQVFSDDEGDDEEIDQKMMSCSADTSFMTSNQPMSAISFVSRQNSKKQQSNTVVCPNCQISLAAASNKTASKELKTATTDNQTSSDSIKRLPSKRGLQDFLVFPKSSKVTIEQSNDEVSEPGSHKKIQTEINGEKVIKIIDTNKKTVPDREQDSQELLNALSSTMDSETKPVITDHLKILTQKSAQNEIQECAGKYSEQENETNSSSPNQFNCMPNVNYFKQKIKQDCELFDNNRKSNSPFLIIFPKNKPLNNLFSNYDECPKVVIETEKTHKNQFLFSPSESSTQEGTQNNINASRATSSPKTLQNRPRDS